MIDIYKVLYLFGWNLYKIFSGQTFKKYFHSIQTQTKIFRKWYICSDFVFTLEFWNQILVSMSSTNSWILNWSEWITEIARISKKIIKIFTQLQLVGKGDTFNFRGSKITKFCYVSIQKKIFNSETSASTEVTKSGEREYIVNIALDLTPSFGVTMNINTRCTANRM